VSNHSLVLIKKLFYNNQTHNNPKNKKLMSRTKNLGIKQNYNTYILLEKTKIAKIVKNFYVKCQNM